MVGGVGGGGGGGVGGGGGGVSLTVSGLQAAAQAQGQVGSGEELCSLLPHQHYPLGQGLRLLQLTHTHTQACTHTHTYTHTQACTHTHTYTHTGMHTHTHADIHTHIKKGVIIPDLDLIDCNCVSDC